MEEIKNKIYAYLSQKDVPPQNIQQIMTQIGYFDQKPLTKLLGEMMNEGLIVKTNKKEKYSIPKKLSMAVGILLMNQKEFGFVRQELDAQNDIFISKKNLGGAYDKDKVLVLITQQADRGYKAEGKIIQVLERNTQTLIGRYQKEKKFGFVIPSSRKFTSDIFIPGKYENGAKNGDIVEVQITEYPKKDKNAEGKVKKVVALKDDEDIYFKIILAENKIRQKFGSKVEKALEIIPDSVEPYMAKDREDLRDEFVFTIDGFDAKDLDDAITIKKLDNGNYKLYVHIADVSEYVTENSAIDKEAFKRATSVYLINVVYPMLPEKLSNGVCSLHPHVDRLALSCIMNINPEGKILNSEVKKTLINSSARLTYDEVSDYLENGDEKVLIKSEKLREILTISQELAKILRNARMQNGSMDFDFPESLIEMNEYNQVTNISIEERRIANKIIEEFMLAANKTIAEKYFHLDLPFVYRVHEKPDPEKLQKLLPVLQSFGYDMKIKGEVNSKQLQELLSKLEGKKEQRLISTLILRSMSKARYSELCLGHYSLAFKYYCHFTSPIRRYPDLQIHRIIKEFIDGKIDKKRKASLIETVKKSAEQSSIMELVADNTENDVDDLRKAQYMKKYVGDVFDGTISSITNFGLFVALSNTVEGLVRYESMMDDHYEFDDINYTATGKRTGKVYQIGDSLKVRLARVSQELRQIDFEIEK
ncbi:ribonuclease R [Criibacterium bergeronii]|uniref:Ribonuclease R n=1 Tax=Criibacterium bergeronii TaxID=1871336 RepID=A0A371IJT0_9FIRM|nr:ribonuclease R [Criibacterium bergeronii]MBS6063791.1 ribonuclease R [Peptostreptococcaceae bacterium]RDY20752.1 ribonuclease R [Criibacterium bergeronii]TRW28324.1 ribonuclease R [Criibacterium bergeronii]